MSNVNNADRLLLRDIKHKCEELARCCKAAGERGYIVSFNLNGAAGTVDNFEIKQMVPINVGLDS